MRDRISWDSGEFIGIGPGAHGRITKNAHRFSTCAITSPTAWLKNEDIEVREQLSKADQLNEALLMGLRTSSGVSLERIKNLGFENELALNQLVHQNFLQIEDGNLIATPSGRLLLNSVLRELA